MAVMAEKPVYIINGFLEAGKTSFIRTTMEDPEFINRDRTLLIIGNSLTNAVKPLLTAHFGKIIYVDLRSYKSMTKKAFSLSKAVEDYAPTQILLFGDAYLFTTDDTLPKP